MTADDIDRMGHVNNSVYLRWIEAVVHNHWRSLATRSEFDAFVWFAVRHEIDYRRPAVIDDLLHLDTRIVEVRRARAWYETIVRRDDQVLVEARSCWCCIDTATNALTVIPRDLASRFLGSSACARTGSSGDIG